MNDLGVTPFLDPLLLSEAEGIEKPSSAIFLRACNSAGVSEQETVHVGDDLAA